MRFARISLGKRGLRLGEPSLNGTPSGSTLLIHCAACNPPVTGSGIAALDGRAVPYGRRLRIVVRKAGYRSTLVTLTVRRRSSARRGMSWLTGKTKTLDGWEG